METKLNLTIILLLLLQSLATAKAVPSVVEVYSDRHKNIMPYDSMQNISTNNLPSLVGQELYFIPNSYWKENGDYNINLITTKPEGSVSTNTKLDGSNLYQPYKSKHGFMRTSYEGLVQKKFRIKNFMEIEDRFGYKWPIIELEDPITKCSLYMDGKNIWPDKISYVILGYYEKNRKKFLNKKYKPLKDNQKIFRRHDNMLMYNNLPDTLKVTDVVFLDQQWSPMALTLIGNDSVEYYIKINDVEYSLIDIAEKEKWDALKSVHENENLNRMIRKYGKSNGTLIAQGKVKIGFTKQMCIDAWGEPIKINTTTNRYSKSEQWVYGGDCYLYFENGKLVTIQN